MPTARRWRLSGPRPMASRTIWRLMGRRPVQPADPGCCAAIATAGRRGRRPAQRVHGAEHHERARAWRRRSKARHSPAPPGSAAVPAGPGRRASRSRTSSKPRLAPSPASGCSTCAASPISSTRVGLKVPRAAAAAENRGAGPRHHLAEPVLHGVGKLPGEGLVVEVEATPRLRLRLRPHHRADVAIRGSAAAPPDHRAESAAGAVRLVGPLGAHHGGQRGLARRSRLVFTPSCVRTAERAPSRPPAAPPRRPPSNPRHRAGRGRTAHDAEPARSPADADCASASHRPAPGAVLDDPAQLVATDLRRVEDHGPGAALLPHLHAPIGSRQCRSASTPRPRAPRGSRARPPRCGCRCRVAPGCSAGARGSSSSTSALRGEAEGGGGADQPAPTTARRSRRQPRRRRRRRFMAAERRPRSSAHRRQHLVTLAGDQHVVLDADAEAAPARAADAP
jgi:hypothetical protein